MIQPKKGYSLFPRGPLTVAVTSALRLAGVKLSLSEFILEARVWGWERDSRQVTGRFSGEWPLSSSRGQKSGGKVTHPRELRALLFASAVSASSRDGRRTFALHWVGPNLLGDFFPTGRHVGKFGGWLRRSNEAAELRLNSVDSAGEVDGDSALMFRRPGVRRLPCGRGRPLRPQPNPQEGPPLHRSASLETALRRRGSEPRSVLGGTATRRKKSRAALRRMARALTHRPVFHPSQKGASRASTPCILQHKKRCATRKAGGKNHSPKGATHSAAQSERGSDARRPPAASVQREATEGRDRCLRFALTWSASALFLLAFCVDCF